MTGPRISGTLGGSSFAVRFSTRCSSRVGSWLLRECHLRGESSLIKIGLMTMTGISPLGLLLGKTTTRLQPFFPRGQRVGFATDELYSSSRLEPTIRRLLSMPAVNRCHRHNRANAMCEINLPNEDSAYTSETRSSNFALTCISRLPNLWHPADQSEEHSHGSRGVFSDAISHLGHR